MIGNGKSQDTLAFFTISYWGRWVMIGLLTAVFGFTAAHASWRLVQTPTAVSGQLVEIKETVHNGRSADYTLLLQDGNSGQTAVTLANNGRILQTLLSGAYQDQAVNLLVRQGKVTAFTPPNGPTIRDTAVTPMVQLLLSLIPLILLIFHLSPDLLERLVGKRR